LPLDFSNIALSHYHQNDLGVHWDHLISKTIAPYRWQNKYTCKAHHCRRNQSEHSSVYARHKLCYVRLEPLSLLVVLSWGGMPLPLFRPFHNIVASLELSLSAVGAFKGRTIMNTGTSQDR
jgi:hypothetical protein